MTVTNDPLTPYSDLVSTSAGDDSADSTTAVTAPGSDSDPVAVHQLSQRAWDELHPEFGVQQDDAPENGDISTSTDSTPMGGGGGAATNPANDLPAPNFDGTVFGNPKGGHFVSDDPTAAEKIVRTARAMLGRPYVWGGEDWSGADCSGLVQLAYKQAGIDMPRLSNYQMSKGKRVDYKDLKPGDLVGWDNSNHVVGADHIAIYIGNNQIIEAPRPGLNIRVSGLFDYDVGQMWAVRIPGKTIAPQAAPRISVPVKRAPDLSTRAIEHASTQRASKPKKSSAQRGPGPRASVA